MSTLSENLARLPRIAAHLILGSREEPFLGALLESLDGAVDTVIVNDNSASPSPHERTLQQSPFGRRRALVVDRTPFSDFAGARNVCLRIHREIDAGDWIAFVDGDEVHSPQLRRIASRLQCVPQEFDFVDGYTWHFFQSFRWYTSIERRMTFYRFKPGVRWTGRVHEHLEGLSGKRLALPYVYAHYGHVSDARRHAEKSRQYSNLGAPGPVLEEAELDDIDVAQYFRCDLPLLLRFGGDHPRDARVTVEELERRNAAYLRSIDGLIARAQPLRVRWRNALMNVNYDQRWIARWLNPLSWRMM